MRYRDDHENNPNLHPIAQIHHEVNRAFERILGEQFHRPFFNMPAIDLREEENQFVIEAELPGIEPQNVDIEVQGNTLVIKGEHRQKEERQGKRMHIVERRHGSFHRSITLPDHAHMDHITADYHNGLLTISVPKDQNKGPRKIQIHRRTQ